MLIQIGKQIYQTDRLQANMFRCCQSECERPALEVNETKDCRKRTKTQCNAKRMKGRAGMNYM